MGWGRASHGQVGSWSERGGIGHRPDRAQSGLSGVLRVDGRGEPGVDGGTLPCGTRDVETRTSIGCASRDGDRTGGRPQGGGTSGLGRPLRLEGSPGPARGTFAMVSGRLLAPLGGEAGLVIGSARGSGAGRWYFVRWILGWIPHARLVRRGKLTSLGRDSASHPGVPQLCPPVGPQEPDRVDDRFWTSRPTHKFARFT